MIAQRAEVLVPAAFHLQSFDAELMRQGVMIVPDADGRWLTLAYLNGNRMQRVGIPVESYQAAVEQLVTFLLERVRAQSERVQG